MLRTVRPVQLVWVPGRLIVYQGSRAPSSVATAEVYLRSFQDFVSQEDAVSQMSVFSSIGPPLIRSIPPGGSVTSSRIA